MTWCRSNFMTFCKTWLCYAVHPKSSDSCITTIPCGMPLRILNVQLAHNHNSLRLVRKSDCKPLQSQAVQALVVRSYYFYANVQLCETRYRDIVTAVIYCNLTTWRETWLWPFSMWRCYVTTVWIYKGLHGEYVKKHFSRNLDIFAMKMTYLNALLSFLLSSRLSARSEAF